MAYYISNKIFKLLKIANIKFSNPKTYKFKIKSAVTHTINNIITHL